MKHNTAGEVTVSFWNILFDINSPSLVKPQSDRLPDIVKTLQNLPKDAIMGLAEVEGNNSKLIAKKLGNQSVYFVEHDRPNDYIGVVSRLKFKSEFINVGEDCKAVVCKYEGLTIVIVHLTLVLRGDKQRKRQIRALLSHIDTESPVVVMGDFNSMYWQGSRKLLEKVGFRSALGRSFLRRLPTAPTKQYRHILPEPLKTLGWAGFTLDDIYIKGVELVDSGIFEGESDHLGVWAKLRLS